MSKKTNTETTQDAGKTEAIGAEKKASVKIKIPPVLFNKTQKVIDELEERLPGSFFSYWTSPSGSVCQNDVNGFYNILQKAGGADTIYLFLKSGGGDGRASLRIIHLLREFAQKVVALVPLTCASAATMMALGADEIHMGPLAFLTAIDTSMTHDLSPVDVDNDRVRVGQNELDRIIRMWREDARPNDLNPYNALFEYIHPLVIGAVDRARSLSERLCSEILSYHIKDNERIATISRTLNTDYPSHTYPITFYEAQRIGLSVQRLDPEVNGLLLKLHELYSEMGQHALTDYDERNYHNNEITNIIECRGLQVYYQIDKDWHYRTDERRWISMNDESSWRRIERVKGRLKKSVFYIR